MRNQYTHGRIFAKVRHAHGLTLTEMSGFLNISISHLSRIEKGERLPGIDMYLGLEKYIGKPMDKIRAQFKKT
ncbi:MAG: helix-turn-helix domain-containing protein [Flavobacteriales bacterium]